MNKIYVIKQIDLHVQNKHNKYMVKNMGYTASEQEAIKIIQKLHDEAQPTTKKEDGRYYPQFTDDFQYPIHQNTTAS